MINIATSVSKSPKYSASKHTSFEEIKKKYESYAVGDQEKLQHPPQMATSKLLKKCKVKEIASMFNSKVSPIMPPDAITQSTFMSNGQYTRESVPSSKAKSLVNDERKPICFLKENNYSQLTVKEKVKLYTQFIDDMSKNKPEVSKYAEPVETNVKKAVARGAVINEKQKSVKHLLKELEARCAFPKQTISPLALQRINSIKNGTKKTKFLTKDLVKTKKCEDNTETVVVKPTPDIKKHCRSRSVSRRRKDQDKVLKKLGIIEPSQKRNNNEMSSSLPIEAYAPPKKIRHLTAEKVSCQKVVSNKQLESLFLTWLRKRYNKDSLQNIKQDIECNSAVDNLLNETAESKEKKDLVAQKTKKSTSYIKKQGDSEPVGFDQITETSNTATESESGLSSLTQITSEESTADTHEKESENGVDFGKPIKLLRKRKTRRNLAVKKDTVYQDTNCKISSDSDLDAKVIDSKIKNKTLNTQPQTQENKISNVVKLNKSLASEISSSKNIRTANTLSLSCSAPSQQQEDNHNNLDLDGFKPSLVDNQITQDLSECNRDLFCDSTVTIPHLESKPSTDSSIDQGFETGSYDTESPTRSPKRSVFDKFSCDTRRMSTESGVSLEENPSHFSTPIKGHLEQTTQQQPLVIAIRNLHHPIYNTENIDNFIREMCEYQDKILPLNTENNDVNVSNPNKSSSDDVEFSNEASETGTSISLEVCSQVA